MAGRFDKRVFIPLLPRVWALALPQSAIAQARTEEKVDIAPTPWS